MANIFFIETGDDIMILRQQMTKEDVVIALSPLAAYALEKSNIPFKLVEYDYCSHTELAEALANYRRNIDEAMLYIDGIIFALDQRFSELQLSPFFSSLFETEVPVLNIVTRIYQIKKLIEKERPAVIKIIDQGEIVSEDVRYNECDGAFGVVGSLINEIIKMMKSQYNYKLIIYEKCEPNKSQIDLEKIAKFKNKFIKSYEKDPHICLRILNKGPNKLINHIKAWLFNGKQRYRILNVMSGELESIKDELKGDGWIVQTFPYQQFTKDRIIKKYKYMAEFRQRVVADTKLPGLFMFCGISYFDLVWERLFRFCDCLEGLLKDYYWLDNYLNNNKYDLVVFQTHTGFNSFNKILPIILKRMNIPYVCWMHGGYGTNKAVSSGYRSSDYLLGDNYFVYGANIKKLIDNYYPDFGLTTHVAGSPHLENRYKNYRKPQNKIKIVTYILGGFAYPLNGAYTTECKKHKLSGHWRPLKEIINVLIKYQDKYCINIRPYPSERQIDFLADLLQDIKATNISLITTKDASLKQILYSSDLLIYNYVSTSFFEAALTSADIFLVDDSDLTKAAEEILARRAFHFREISEFCNNLDRYLSEGRFYQKNDDAFLRHYMDIENKTLRGKTVSKILRSIVTKREEKIS
ncbi:hypothetical protein ACFL5U_00550 [Candidatus Margulisiibacteriota bacterium]